MPSCSLQGLVATWQKKLENQAKVARGTESLKKLGKIGPRGDVYCVLKCEGQVKRTALAKGHQNPMWKEDIAFKSVQITSELQVKLVISFTSKNSWTVHSILSAAAT